MAPNFYLCVHFFSRTTLKQELKYSSYWEKKSLPLFQGEVQEDERMSTPRGSEKAWPNNHAFPECHPPSSPQIWSPFLPPSFLSPSHFLSSFPLCVKGLLPALFSGWKGYSSLLDIVLVCECTSIDLHLGEEKEKGGEGGGEKEKHTVTHSLTTWLPRGHGQAMAENFNCVSFSFCLPTPPASPSHQLLLSPHPAQAHLLRGIQHRDNISVLTPPPLLCSDIADTDPLCGAQDPKKCSCRIGAQERQEALLAKAGPRACVTVTSGLCLLL